MSEPKITAKDEVADIEKLKEHIRTELGPTGHGWCGLSEDLLARFESGVIALYGITPDARVCFFYEDPNFIIIQYGRGQFKLSLIVLGKRVEIHSMDRLTGRPIELLPFYEEEVVL